MKNRIQYKEPTKSARDRTIPPTFCKTECLESCPHLIYNHKGSENIYAHCLKYYVPLDSELDISNGRVKPFSLIKRHTSCRKEFPDDGRKPETFNPLETHIIKVPVPEGRT